MSELGAPAAPAAPAPVLGHCASAHGVKRKGHSDQGRAAVGRRRKRCGYAAADERVGCPGGAGGPGPGLGHCASAHGVKRKGHSDQGRAAVGRRRKRCGYAAADERVGCPGGAGGRPRSGSLRQRLTALNAKVTPVTAGPLLADAVSGADTPPPMSELGAPAAPAARPRSGSLRQRLTALNAKVTPIRAGPLLADAVSGADTPPPMSELGAPAAPGGPGLGHCASAHGVKRKGHSGHGRAAVGRRRKRCGYAAADERVGCPGGAGRPRSGSLRQRSRR